MLVVVLATTEPDGDLELCSSADPAIWDALGAVTGQFSDGLAGFQLLVDGNGWVRAFKAGPDAAAWDDPGTLAAALATIAATPIAAAEGRAGHRH